MESKPKSKWSYKIFVQLSIACALVFGGAFQTIQTLHADSPPVLPTKRNTNFSDAALIPIQAGGRIKPLDSYAREVTLLMTGSRTFQGWDPVNLLFSWLVEPMNWSNQPFIQITRQDVRRQLGLDEKRTRFSPDELFENDILRQYAGESTQVSKNNEVVAVAKADPRETELKRVFERMTVYRSLVSGDAWTVIPEKGKAWLNLAMVTLQDHESLYQHHPLRNHFVAMVKAYQKADTEGFQKEAAETRKLSESLLTSSLESDPSLLSKLKMEVCYNKLRPNLWSWILYLLGSLGFLLVGFSRSKNKWLNRLPFGLIGAGFLVNLLALILRSYVAGRPPVSNMYESIVWVGFGTVLFAWILFYLQRSTVILTVAGFASALTLIVADAAPTLMDPGIHPLVPVLRSNYWLTIHVLTITLGYAAFLLTLGLSNVTLYQFWKKASGYQARVNHLNHLTYRAMQFGVVLLAAGTILGGVWADYSWGRFWGWDPKETWALIALLSYVAILHARYTGWIGEFGYAVWTMIAYLSVLMAWYGVNFILGAGLHSYGFSSGGLGFVMIFTGLELSYAILITAKHRRRSKKI